MGQIDPQRLTPATGRPFTVRTGEPGDAAALLAYIRGVAAEGEFLVVEPGEFNITDEQEQHWLRDHFEHPCKLVLVAEGAGRIVGCLSFENGTRRRMAHRGVLGVSVHKRWRGQGVGEALVRSLLAWAEAHPRIEKVTLDVFATNHRAIRLYEKLGFQREGLKPRDVRLGPGRYVDVVAMYRFV